MAHHFILGILPASVVGGRTVSGAWRARSGLVGPRISPPLSPRLGSGLRVSDSRVSSPLGCKTACDRV